MSASVELSSSEFRQVALRTDAQGCVALSRFTEGRSSAATDTSWTVAGRLVAATEDSATVDVRWMRRHSGHATATVAPFEESRRVVLREGQPYPLDIVRAPSVASAQCDRVTIQLRFEVVGAAEFADAVLRYDLWLVHHDPGRGDTTDQVQASGRQGQSTAYVFAPVHHGSDGRMAQGAQPEGIDTEVSGTLRGRVRGDGSIVLTVQTWRSVSPRGRSEGLGNGGSKVLTVQPGETIEVALPPVSGRIGGQDMSSLFQGQRTSIRITTTRLR